MRIKTVLATMALALGAAGWAQAQTASAAKDYPNRPITLVVPAGTYLLIPGAWYVASGALAGLAATWLLAEDAA